MGKRLGVLVVYLASVLAVLNAQSDQSVRASIANFKSGDRVPCTMSGDGTYKCDVHGTSQGLDAQNSRLLLWVKPVEPAGDGGFYLQRRPNGISKPSASGSWSGLAQLGNQSYPPKNGDRFDVAISVVSAKDADRLESQRGVVMLAQPEGEVVARATDVRAAIK